MKKKLIAAAMSVMLILTSCSTPKANNGTDASKADKNGTAITGETEKETKKTLRLVVDFKSKKGGSEDIFTIEQFDDKGKSEFYYSSSNTSSYPLLSIYEENTTYIIKLKKYISVYDFEDKEIEDLSIVRDQYDYKNEYYIKEVYEYSNDHQLVKSTAYYPNGSYEYGDYKTRTTEYIRNKNGLVTQKTSTFTGSSSKPDVTDVYKYEYDKNGKLTNTFINGKASDENETKYDDHGNVIQRGRGNGIIETHERTYNAAGLCVYDIVKTINKEGETAFVDKYRYEYNDHGDVILVRNESVDEKYDVHHEYEYDSNGKMTYHHFYTQLGGTNTTINWKYDSDGDLLQEIEDDRGNIHRKKYKYWGEKTDDSQDTSKDLTSYTIYEGTSFESTFKAGVDVHPGGKFFDVGKDNNDYCYDIKGLAESLGWRVEEDGAFFALSTKDGRIVIYVLNFRKGSEGIAIFSVEYEGGDDAVFKNGSSRYKSFGFSFEEKPMGTKYPCCYYFVSENYYKILTYTLWYLPQMKDNDISQLIKDLTPSAEVNSSSESIELKFK